MHSTCLIDEFGPLPVVTPQTVDELAATVTGAAANSQAIYPMGGGTMVSLGNRPRQQGVAVDLRSLNKVIDYPARDMTITVGAGITIAQLQKLLAPENQQLPIDIPNPETATLGGSLAVNVSGSRRYGYGTLRDYLLGFSAINDAGETIKAGGRVVKNVAGYDMCKLFIGSLGTLGVITQATLKLRPLPDDQALVCLACMPEQIDEILQQLHTSRTRPISIDVLNERATRWLHQKTGTNVPAGRWSVIVGFDGNAEAVKWQVQQLVMEARSRYSLEAYVNAATQRFWQSLAEFTSQPGALVFKANLLAAGTAAFCRQVDGLNVTVLANAGNGIVYGLVEDVTQADAATLIGKLRQQAREHKGSVVLLRCPPAWKDVISVWGPPPENIWLMRKVKEALDPKSRFNPGRFIDGI